MNKIFEKNASKRSVAEPSTQVTVSTAATAEQPRQFNDSKPQRKKAKRNPFTEVKNKSLKLYESLKWLLDDQFDEDKLLRKCVDKVVKETTDYNERAFKKDVAMKMSHLLNDRKFIKKCWDAEWDIFCESQKCVWAKDSVYQQIRDHGIDRVPGFNTPDILIYSHEDLMHELKALGFDEEFFKDDPYTYHYKQNHPEETSPRI